MSFIGVQLLSTADVGIQLLHTADGYPELQFTLLTTTFEAKGPGPLVWLFYKLIGGQENAAANCVPDDTPARLKTTGFTRVWSEPMDDGVIFRNRAKLTAQIAVPSLLIALLPMTLLQLETQGSSTLQNTIRKDIKPAVERFQAAYMEWVSGTG
jgi:hypothetical protein